MIEREGESYVDTKKVYTEEERAKLDVGEGSRGDGRGPLNKGGLTSKGPWASRRGPYDPPGWQVVWAGDPAHLPPTTSHLPPISPPAAL